MRRKTTQRIADLVSATAGLLQGQQEKVTELARWVAKMERETPDEKWLVLQNQHKERIAKKRAAAKHGVGGASGPSE